MLRPGFMERLLTRRFGEQRAAEVTGDLLEQYTPFRARWEMLQLTVALRRPELAGLLLISLALVTFLPARSEHAPA